MSRPVRPAIAVIGLNLSSGLQTLVRACHELGAEVVLVHEPYGGSSAANGGGLAQLHRRRLSLVDLAVEVPRIDPVRALAALQSIGDRYELRGVYAGSEKHVEVVARAAAAYGLPGPGLPAASISRNKLMQRLVCRRHGVPVPGFAAISSREEADRFLRAVTPAVAKPCTAWGSSGVRRLDSPADLDAYLAALARRGRDAFPFLLEEYMPGRELSVECLVVDGEPRLTSVTHKGKGREPYFVETLQAVPATLPVEERAAFHDLAARIVAVTGMETGVLHLEAINHPETSTVHPVEWAVREPGYAIMDLVDWRFGGEATRYLAAMHLGATLPPPPVEDPRRIGATVFIELPPGTVLAVSRERDPATVPGLVDFDFYARPGDVIAPAQDNWSTQGGYTALAEDIADFRRVLDELDEAFGVLVRTETGQETWVRVSAQARAQVVGDPNWTVGAA